MLNFYNELNKEEKELLIDQICQIDFQQIFDLYESSKRNEIIPYNKIKPLSYTIKNQLSKYETSHYEAIGEEVISNQKYAVVTLAGGQGTRLGYDGPKGTYDIGLDSHKSLFELLADSLKEQGKKYNVVIPWFIMTSEENNVETIEFFAKNKFFGFEENKSIFFFKQGELPMVDAEGKILIGEDGLIKEAADGHGGIYEALVRNGMTKKMRELGAEWIFIGGVDNCLIQKKK